MKSLIMRLGLTALVGMPSTAIAQNLPNHFDINAREQALDLNNVPAIRFLTTPDFPPFNYRDEGGELVGFNVDLADAICEALQVACTMQAWPWDQAADALADRQGDVLLAGLALSDINAERFDFSQTYLMLPARFVTAKTELTKFAPELWQTPQTEAQLEINNPVAVRAGSNHQQFLQAYFPLAKTIEFQSEFDALEALSTGAAYAYFGDALRSSFWLNEHVDCCAFAGEAYFNTHYFGQGLAAALSAGNDQVRRAVNVALFRLNREGVLDELYLRWFPVGFY